MVATDLGSPSEEVDMKKMTMLVATVAALGMTLAAVSAHARGRVGLSRDPLDEGRLTNQDPKVRMGEKLMKNPLEKIEKITIETYLFCRADGTFTTSVGEGKCIREGDEMVFRVEDAGLVDDVIARIDAELYLQHHVYMEAILDDLVGGASMPGDEVRDRAGANGSGSGSGLVSQDDGNNDDGVTDDDGNLTKKMNDALRDFEEFMKKQLKDKDNDDEGKPNKGDKTPGSPTDPIYGSDRGSDENPITGNGTINPLTGELVAEGITADHRDPAGLYKAMARWARFVASQGGASDVGNPSDLSEASDYELRRPATRAFIVQLQQTYGIGTVANFGLGGFAIEAEAMVQQ